MKNLYRRIRSAPLLVQFLMVGWLLIMLLLPFHGFVSTWGGTTVGPLWLWKAWKEILLAGMVVLTAMQLLNDRSLLKILWQSWITRIIVMYGLLHVVVAVFVGNQTEPLVAGLAINLRLVTFFLISQVIFSYIKLSRRELLAIIFVPLGGVVLFGLLQLFVLPYDFLTSFGYNKDTTIAPFNTIDQQLDQLRIMSTTRGPNPLGAYLILPLTLLYMLLIIFLQKCRKNKTRRDIATLAGAFTVFIAGLVVLYGSHSRSAWIGFAISIGLYTLLIAPKRVRMLLVGAGIMLSLIAGFTVYQFKETSFVQNVIIHDNPDVGPEVTSNSERRNAYTKAVADIQQKPLLGCAPGCAGPASFYDPDGTRLAENYYLQVGQEIGIFGVLLFAGFIVLVARKLYGNKDDTLALVLLASLIGLSVANMLLHVWADDTLAYVWWGIAGAAFGARASYKHKQD